MEIKPGDIVDVRWVTGGTIKKVRILKCHKFIANNPEDKGVMLYDCETLGTGVPVNVHEDQILFTNGLDRVLDAI